MSSDTSGSWIENDDQSDERYFSYQLNDSDSSIELKGLEIRQFLLSKDVDLELYGVHIWTSPEDNTGIALSLESEDQAEPIQIEIRHGAVLKMIRRWKILVSDEGYIFEHSLYSGDTILHLKQRVLLNRKEQQGEPIRESDLDEKEVLDVHITLEGKPLTRNDLPLANANLPIIRNPDEVSQSLSHVIFARLKLTVIDEKLGEQTIYVHSDDTLDAIRREYSKKMHRIIQFPDNERNMNKDEKQQSEPEFLMRDDVGDQIIKLNRTETLYQQKVNANYTIFYKPPPLTIHIVEQKSSANTFGMSDQRAAFINGGLDPVKTPINGVYDWWTVRRLKDEYNTQLSNEAAQVTSALDDSDILIFSSQELVPEDTELYRFQIQDNANIFVKREESHVVVCVYVCSECGSDVKLKKTDAVRCTDCGNRIVFKKRENKPLQHICR